MYPIYAEVYIFSYTDSAKYKPIMDSAKTLAVALILSRIDYCNALLAGLPEDRRLQRIQNSAARLLTRKSKRVSATALLRSLYWLPVKARIEYKIASLCHQCLNNNRMPSYLSELISPYVPQRDLRSADSSLLAVPRFSLQTCGMRAFSSFGQKSGTHYPSCKPPAMALLKRT